MKRSRVTKEDWEVGWDGGEWVDGGLPLAPAKNTLLSHGVWWGCHSDSLFMRRTGANIDKSLIPKGELMWLEIKRGVVKVSSVRGEKHNRKPQEGEHKKEILPWIQQKHTEKSESV